MAISKQTKTTIVSTIIPLVLTSLIYFFHQNPIFQGIELKTLDARLKASSKNIKANSDIVVLLIDDASLQAMVPIFGRWPWNRSAYGELLDFLSQAGVKAVLFDILFTEPQVPRNEAGELGDADQVLVMSSASSGVTHHAFQLVNDTEDEVNKGLLNRPLPDQFVENFGVKNVEVMSRPPEGNNFYLPINELWENTFSMGVVEFSSDNDGVYRSTNLLRPYQGNFYPVLSMSYPLRAMDYKKIKLYDDKLWLDDLEVPLLLNGRYLINMKKEFNNYSISGVYATIQKINKGESEGLIVDPEEFKDKIVVIGASAVGVDDLKLTPIGQSVPGVYLHASVLSNILDRDFISKVSPALTFAVFGLINIAVSLLIMTGGSLAMPLVLFFLTLIGHIGTSFYWFDHDRVWLLTFAPLLTVGLNFLSLFIFKTATEGKEKKFLKAAFGNYISPELIDIMYQSGEAPKLGGDVGTRTAYFTDIQGFSTFSEQLSAPRLVELLNEYLTVMTDILVEESGTLDKYEGDAIIAFFGAPMPLEDHAVRAIRTALRMQSALGGLRDKWKSEGDKWPKIVHDMRMRIGINTGEIVTGNMGSKMRMNYTMMGDAVNLAARLEESAKQYGIFTQISHYTFDHIKDHYVCRELDTIRVVGKSESITTYEPLFHKDHKDELLAKLCDLFHKGRKAYSEQRWDEAVAFFEESAKVELDRFPELHTKTNPSKIYIERCREFMKLPPPPDWDGVYNMTHK